MKPHLTSRPISFLSQFINSFISYIISLFLLLFSANKLEQVSAIIFYIPLARNPFTVIIQCFYQPSFIFPSHVNISYEWYAQARLNLASPNYSLQTGFCSNTETIHATLIREVNLQMYIFQC